MTRSNTNVQSLIARRALNIDNASLNQTLARLSKGLRINSGREDPAGLTASKTLRSKIRAIDTAVTDATRADTIVAVAEGGLREVSSLLLDLEYLVDQTANLAGVTEFEDASHQLQIDSILSSINRLSEATAFGDKKLLNGTLNITTSGVNVETTAGLAGTETTEVPEVSTGKLGNANVGYLASLSTGMANDLASGNFNAVQRIVRAAISQIATLRERLNDFQKGTLRTTIDSLQVAGENVRSAASVIRDADFAPQTSRLTRARILAVGSGLMPANAQPRNALECCNCGY